MVPRARIRVIVTVVAATGTEARAIRRYATDGITVVQAGIALKHAHRFDGLVISCGLAGGVRAGLPAGTPLIPERVYGPDDREIVCDTQAVGALTRAARDLGCTPVHDPLFTSRTLVRGIARKDLEARGFAGVDMETALLDAPRIACIRVVLDTQEREISSAWLRPWSIVFHPSALHDLPFLLREAPRAADLAARIAVQGAASLHL